MYVVRLEFNMVTSSNQKCCTVECILKTEKLELNRSCNRSPYGQIVHTAVDTRELVRRVGSSAAVVEVGTCLEAAREVEVEVDCVPGASRRTQMTPCASEASQLEGKSAGISLMDEDVIEDVSAKK